MNENWHVLFLPYKSLRRDFMVKSLKRNTSNLLQVSVKALFNYKVTKNFD